MLNPEDFASADDYVAAVKSLEDHAAHGDHHEMATQHAALFDLVPRSEATHVAVSNGSWFDAATWHEGRIPDAGSKVLIPQAISVTYDGVDDVSLFTVRVDGKMDFATDKDTLLKVDTFIVSTTGKLEIGTEENPVQPGVSAQIVIADNGPIDVAWDPFLLSRGVISHGEVSIHGQEKTSHLKVAVDAMKGETQLILEEPPVGWQVGDQLVLTGTHYVPWKWDGEKMVYQGTQDEELVITAIDGNVITFDRPLSFDHDTPRDDLKAYVANYSRNVVISTENAEDIPVYQRGHTMFMHSDNVDVRYAEFQELGRTDKSERAVDAASVEDVQSDTNVQGRYAVHLHMTGVDGDHDPAILIGNAVWGSPGWGITHHQSNALIENNATYNTFGAGFVAETGDEIGAWRFNIAIKAEGVGGSGAYAVKRAEDVHAFDLGRTGEGFWFQGRLVEAEGNVAAGVNHGFVYMHRGSLEQVDADNLDQPEILRYKTEGGVNVPPIQHFIDNEVLASHHGLIIVKAGPNQGHDVRSVIDSFTAWEVMAGIHAQYTSHYTFLDLDLLATSSSKALYGIEFGNNSFDMVVNGATVEGFEYGAILTKISTFGLPADEFGYVLIDFSSDAPLKDFDPAVDLILTGQDLVAGRLQLDLAWAEMPIWDWNAGRVVYIDGTKTDSIGTVSYSVGSEEHMIGQQEMSALLSHEGYYTTADGRKIVIVEEYFADRATGEIHKIGIPIQLGENVPLTQGKYFLTDGDAIYRGEIDLDSAPPLAVDDTATTQRGTGIIIDVLANDSDPDGDALILDGLVQPRHGSVKANADGTVTYMPDRNFVGEDSFYYWVTDDNGNYTRATVKLVVVNDADDVGEVDQGDGSDDGIFEPLPDDTTTPTDPEPTEPEPTEPEPTDPELGETPPEADDSEFDQVIIGTDGNDKLTGGPGNDLLIGGLGRDELTGGAGNDTFRFNDIAESPAGGQRSRITDFAPGEDKIDLSGIDAIIGGNNDAFTFIGADVFSAAGQVRQFHQGNITVIEGDVTGDGNADFQIALLTRGLVLSADDFVL